MERIVLNTLDQLPLFFSTTYNVIVSTSSQRNRLTVGKQLPQGHTASEVKLHASFMISLWLGAHRGKRGELSF